MTDTKAALDAWNYISLFCGVNVKNEQDREALDKRFKILHSALTTPPAPTVMGDDVREAIEWLSGYCESCRRDCFDGGDRPEILHIETLIRAATQPPQPYPSGLQKATVHVLLDTLAAAARGETLDPETCQQIEGIAKEYAHKDFTQDDVLALYRCGHHKQPPQATDVNYLIRDLDIIRVILESSKDAVSADFQRIERLQDFIRNAALQSPAVPREVVDALRDLRGCCNLPADNKFKQSRMKKADESLALLGGKEG